MTSTNDLVKAFLASGGKVQSAPAGIAYGVDAEVDRRKRQMERDRSLECEERYAEQRMELVREGHHTAGRRGAYEALNATIPKDSEIAEPRFDGRRVRFERF